MGSNSNRYDDWHALHADDNDIATPWHDFAKKALASIDIRNKTLLEIGCGRGGFARYMLRTHPTINRLFACDYSESALLIAQEKSHANEKASFQKEDIQNLSFPDSFFDCIISCETIEHVPSPRKALHELCRVLKPGGTLILTCPNYFNLFGIWCLYRKFIGKPFTEGGQPYVNYVMVPIIYATLRRLGFRVDHFHSSELIIPARVPKTFYGNGTPALFRYLGYRTYYMLVKKNGE